MSSTKEIALASPFSAIDRPRASVRSFQMRLCAAAAVAAISGVVVVLVKVGLLEIMYG